MADPSLAIHKAVFGALDTVLSCEVYDAVPQGAAFPYVTLDTWAVDDESFLVGDASRVFGYLHFWSQQRGQQEVLELMETARQALDRQTLALDTGRWVDARVTRRQTQREPDNETFMGRMTVEIVAAH